MTAAMNLPSELVLEFLQYLDKSDLKNSRLVCKLWSGCASECLFSKVFFSPHHLDIQTFVSITEDPRLSKCVKELEYDAIHFSPDIKMSEYFRKLWYQTGILAPTKVSLLNNPDHEVVSYFQLRNGGSRSRHEISEAQKQCNDFAFIQRGYLRFLQEASFEKTCMEQNSHLAVLVRGLGQLTGLKTVKLRCEWPVISKLGSEGSPLARSWHPLHVYPYTFRKLSDPTFPYENLNPIKIIKDFRVLTYALAKSGKPGLRDFLMETTIGPAAFTHREKDIFAAIKHGKPTYQGLENVKLRLALWFDGRDIFRDKLEGLQRLLESMTALKQFELDLPTDRYQRPVAFFPYANVFPNNGHWPQLHTFKVRNLDFNTRELINLLAIKMPNLTHLEFGSVGLLDGIWEGVVEYLKVSNRLSSFDLADDCDLFHHGGAIYLVKGPRYTLYGDGRMLSHRREQNQKIVDYVNNGRKDTGLKHPCLLSHQPAHLSITYLDDVLRYCTINGIDDSMEGSIKLILEEYARHPQMTPEYGGAEVPWRLIGKISDEMYAKCMHES